MSDSWVVNASPIIVLSHINEVELLSKLATKVVIPEAVVTEINTGPEEDPARQVLAKGHFNVVKTPEPTRELLAWDLGLGETAVLSYTVANPGWTAILDDAAARSCARSFGIPRHVRSNIVGSAESSHFIRIRPLEATKGVRLLPE